MQATLSKNHSTRTLKINAFCFASDKKILYVFEKFQPNRESLEAFFGCGQMKNGLEENSS
jgi:hypothetical protein